MPNPQTPNYYMWKWATLTAIAVVANIRVIRAGDTRVTRTGDVRVTR